MVSFGRKGATAEVEAPEEQAAPAAQPVVAAPGPSQLAAFPRVNLIPDEIAREQRVRQAKLVFGGAIAASVVAVGGLYMMAAGQVSSAQEQLDAATARGIALSSEAAKYADVPKVKADLASAQEQQALALGGEVRWSFVLNNLGLTVPSGTSISTLKGNISAGAPAAGESGVKSVLGNDGVGSLTFEGEALDNGKVASFLEAMSRNTGVIDPFATVASKDDKTAADGSATKPTVRFAATATLSAKALSHRYDVKGN